MTTSTRDQLTLTFHGGSFLELSYRDTAAFIDPVFSSTLRAPRRGRRVRGATRPCDYVFVTQDSDHLDDALDVLEDSDDAVLVGTDAICRMAQAELRISRDRLLDLHAWERASDEDFRVTAVPTTAPSFAEEGRAMLEELASGFALPRQLQSLSGRNLPIPSELPGARSLARLFGGIEPLRRMGPLRGRPGLGYLFEARSGGASTGQTVLHLGAGVHGGTDERELEDIASLADANVLVLDVGSSSVESVVRATRVFEPATLLLYRSQDPYARGRRTRAVPISDFAEAVHEDLGDAVDALHLRPSDRFVLEPPAAESDATKAAKPAEKSNDRPAAPRRDAETPRS